MTKILVLYYSSWGHVETLANTIAEGARGVDGVSVDIGRVPETIPAELAANFHMKLDQAAPVMEPEALAGYDAIIFGSPTRFGNMAAQMRNFLDRTGGLWARGALVGKVASAFTSTGTGGGNEVTVLTTIPTLMHHGMIYVGLPYAAPELADISEVRGGSPYGAGTLAGADGTRQPTEKELSLARFQGRHVAEVTAALVAGRQARGA